MNFNCVCGFVATVESVVVDHMGKCVDFAAESPLRKLFDLTQLQHYNIEELLTFKADLQSQVNMIQQLLLQKGRPQNPLEAYSQFTIPFSNKAESRTHNVERIRTKVKEPTITIVEPTSSRIVEQRTKSEEQVPDDYTDFENCVGCQSNRMRKGNKLLPIECGHNMCQDCFSQLYRGTDELTCLACREPFDTQFRLSAMSDWVHCVCRICERGFVRDENLRRHVTNLHMGSERKFCCDQCHKTFANMAERETHRRTKHIV